MNTEKIMLLADSYAHAYRCLSNAELIERRNALEKALDERPLQSAIADVMSRHFRTDSDTGANSNAMIIMNTFRALAGMDRISRDDLPTWCPTCKVYSLKHEHAESEYHI